MNSRHTMAGHRSRARRTYVLVGQPDFVFWVPQMHACVFVDPHQWISGSPMNSRHTMAGHRSCARRTYVLVGQPDFVFCSAESTVMSKSAPLGIRSDGNGLQTGNMQMTANSWYPKCTHVYL